MVFCENTKGKENNFVNDGKYGMKRYLAQSYIGGVQNTTKRFVGVTIPKK